MFNVSMAEDSAKVANRCVRAYSDAWAAWGDVAAYGASLAPQAAGVMFNAGSPKAAAPQTTQWAADAVARLMQAQRATFAAHTEALRAVTSMPAADLASAQFAVNPFFGGPGEAPAPSMPAAKTKPAEAKKPKQTKPAAKKSAAPKRSAFLARPVGAPDDLTQIKGIGPKLAGSLQDAGIHHFWQIAALSNKDVEKVDAQLKLSGRIARDSWIKQARDLMTDAEG